VHRVTFARRQPPSNSALPRSRQKPRLLGGAHLLYEGLGQGAARIADEVQEHLRCARLARECKGVGRGQVGGKTGCNCDASKASEPQRRWQVAPRATAGSVSSASQGLLLVRRCAERCGCAVRQAGALLLYRCPTCRPGLRMQSTSCDTSKFVGRGGLQRASLVRVWLTRRKMVAMVAAFAHELCAL
jgi:hypothetical protein